MSKVTIIIPLTYKSKHLDECLESIGAQDQQNINVFLVSGSSYVPDEKETDKLVKKYSGRFPVSRKVCNEGSSLSDLRNFGIRESRDDYVMFMDQDDVLEPGVLNGMIEAAPNLPAPLVYTCVRPMYRYVSGYHDEEERNLTLLHDPDEDRMRKSRPAIDCALEDYSTKSAGDYLVGAREDIEDISVLGCMFGRSFLKKNNIYFSHEIHIYQDASFVCNVLINSEEDQCMTSTTPDAYIRRSGSFRYREEKEFNWRQRLDDYMKAYDESYSYSLGNLRMFLMVQESMCLRYLNYVVRLITKWPDSDWSHTVYGEFSRQMQRVHKRVYRGFDKAEKKHLNLLREGNYKGTINYMPVYVKRKKRMYLFSKRSNVVRAIADKLFGTMAIRDRYMVFESGNGKRFSGDPKYIYMYLRDNYPGEYRLTWIAENPDEMKQKIPGRCSVVKKNSFMYYYHILRDKYWISDDMQPIWWYKSDDQTFIETGRGVPEQKLLYDNPAYPNVPSAIHRGLDARVSQWNVLISPCRKASERFASGFRVPKEKILEQGSPRDDLLINGNNSETKADLKRKLNLPEDRKIILYAPVWREQEQPDVDGSAKIVLGLHRMHEQLGKDYIILLRFQEGVREHMVIDEALKGFAYDCSGYDDVVELMLVSDVLITDYSSIVFDYAYLKRPIFFFLYDQEQYDRDSSFFYDHLTGENAPGLVCRTTQEIVDAILHPEKQDPSVATQFEKFYNEFCVSEGRAAQTLARTVFEEMADIFEYEDGSNDQEK